MTNEDLQRVQQRAAERQAAENQQWRPHTSRPVAVGPLVFAALENGRGEHTQPKRLQSPIEEHFAHFLTKALHPDTRLVAQHEVRTGSGVYRLDFVLADATGLRLGIECDGAKFHNRTRDAWRDASILGERAVRDIVRIEGKDIHRRPWDVLFLLSRLYQGLFSDRGRRLSRQLASKEVLEADGPLPEFVYYARTPELDDEAMCDPDEEVSHSGFSDFLHLGVAGFSEHASKTWRLRYRRMLAEPRMSIDELARLEERAGGIW